MSVKPNTATVGALAAMALASAHEEPVAEVELKASPAEVLPQQRHMKQGEHTVVVAGVKQRLRRARNTGFVSARQQKKLMKAARQGKRGAE